MEAKKEESRDEILAIDLPAPQGWKKKLAPRKGGTPMRNEIVFISPTGEEIKNKRQLDQYLKSHPGGISASEFDWGTGDTPRRSARISEKSKATDNPESEPPIKVQKKSSSKKEAKEDDDIDGESETAVEREIPKEEIKESTEVEMKDVEDVGDHNKGEVAMKAAMTDVEDVGDHNKGEVTPADRDNMKDSDQKTKEETDEINKEKLRNEGTTNETSAGKEDDAGDKSLVKPGMEQEQPEAEAPSQLPVPSETSPSEKDVKIVKDAVRAEVDAKAEKELKDMKAGEEDQPNKETPTEKVSNPEEDESNNQEVGKLVENHSVSCPEAPNEPNAPQVSC